MWRQPSQIVRGDSLLRERVILFPALTAFVLAKAAPPFEIFDPQNGVFLYVHLVLELFAVLVASLVVLMAWHTIDPLYGRASNLLVFGFSIVAGCDLLHSLSYQGMPAFLVPSNTPSAIFFWLCGRSAELLTISLLAVRFRLPGKHWHWQLGALTVLAVLLILGTYRLDLFPRLFNPGQGVTPFKARIEYALFAVNMVLAGWFWHLSRTEKESRSILLAMSCVMMGMAELLVTSYRHPTDFTNIFAHVFKVLAYGFIFRSTFRISVTLPFALLRESRNELKRQQQEVESILRHVSGGIMRLNVEQRVVYVNATERAYLGHAAPWQPDMPLHQFLCAQDFAQIEPHVLRAFAGDSAALEMTIDDGAQTRHLAITIAPQRSEEGVVIGCVLLAIDITASRRTLGELKKTVRDLSELSAALDAHAIVTVTYANDIILRVNEKFCAISQYLAEELVGQTHAVLNSGRHPPQFFQDLWTTISKAEVWSGEICNRAKDGSLFWVQTTIVPFIGPNGVPDQYIAIRADITARKLIEQETEKRVFYDALTELPNRRLLADRLSRSQLSSQRSGQLCALVFLDLDDFKGINDVHGHSVGDSLLMRVGHQLARSVRETDTVARFGGDEFVVLLTELGEDMGEAAAVVQVTVEHMMAQAGQDYAIGSAQLRCSISAGVVLFQGTAVDGEKLMQQADIALYKAKAGDRSRCYFFDPQLQTALIRETTLSAQLRQALPAGQLRLFYQPVVDAHASITGVEALIRWAHPEQGMISPAYFVPLAEKSSLIIEIGSWVLETACSQLLAWAAEPATARLTIAVNVSPRQFSHAGFVCEVKRVLSAAGVSPALLKLEITEGMLLHNVEETIAKMDALRQLGVRFALDDFGTGYSSLSYLQRLPLAQMKIDQSFVRHMTDNGNDAAIVRTILSLAQALELDVVAEGVETEAQHALLVADGCGQFQGYLFARPMPIEELQGWMAAASVRARPLTASPVPL